MADRTKEKWNTNGRITNAEVVTPHATEKREYDALFIGNVNGDPTSVGNLVLRARDNKTSDVTLYNVLAGTFLPIATTYIRATTTCSNIIGFDCEE